MLAAILFAINITAPNLLLMALGFLLQKKATIDADFVNIASKIVFNYCLPCLLFFSVLKSEIHFAEQLNLLIAGILVTFALFFMAELYAKFFVNDVRDKGVFVQGVFRSNMGIMGLAMVASAYGDKGLSIGAVYMGVVTILYNILAVITLSRTDVSAKGFAQKARNMGKKMATNPLIIALIAAFAYKLLNLPELPEFITKTGKLLANIALPLALICAGASINARAMLSPSGVSMQASIGRVVIAPIAAVAAGLVFALNAVQFGVLFMMVASPAAAASYIMAKSMGGNDVLAANILAFTTVASVIGMGVGMAVLRTLGWV
ncbi:auxin efflux carrier [Moraxella macacae 0408225]|uniref:Auxin efflux carrier n=1 Tax=Moraxella macacae 0408225 TaxID=1230338 RepID=L2F525_9GAMM|nr:AEC family transporter [Moraxella macacae]ELA08139.1 auxin efflux carrier [Moraxella macacae 0408225]